MKKYILILLFIANAILCYSQKNDSLTLELTKDMEGFVKENSLVGFSVAIYNDEGTLYKKGFGYSDKQEKKEYTENTIQNIGSISKTFIGIALLKAQELGKLNLDDPINNHLPIEVVNPYHPNNAITIRQITSHTSSIRDRDLWYGFNCYVLKEKKKPEEKKKLYFSNPDQMISMGELFENYLVKGSKSYKKKNFSKHRPGEHYEYSNIAAALGAYIVEQATGEDFKSFTQEYILDPLEMNNTAWSFTDIDFDNHTKLYTKSQKRIAFYSLVTYPDGGLISSTDDMTKYASELIKGYHGEGIILTPKSYKAAFTSALDDNCGVFFDITDKNLIGHNGSDPGVTTLMYYDPQTRIGKYLQVNTELSKKGLNNLLAIWNKLKEYETQFDQNTRTNRLVPPLDRNN